MPQQPSGAPLWELSVEAGDTFTRFLSDRDNQVRLKALADRTSFNVRPATLQGRNVLIASDRQITAALALIELDGIAHRIIICPPDFAFAHLQSVISTGEVDTVVSEQPPAWLASALNCVICNPGNLASNHRQEARLPTEWVLFTSGTTGTPKMVMHTASTLIGPVQRARALGNGAVWSTFYDIRRYGGLQILLRALVAGGSMVFSDAKEPAAHFLQRAAANHVTHISGTPSHWRRALMSPAARSIAPEYVRLSGEVADQAILDKLRNFYPSAKVAHAFASTEAGLAFDVGDGQAGFPSHLISQADGPVELRVVDGSLRIRSGRTALGYIGNHPKPLADEDGFIDTGDLVQLRGDRYYFAGRREGIINVGGLKVHPEEIEAVINTHPQVHMSFVRARTNAITGAIVVADVVVKPASGRATMSSSRDEERFRAEIIEICRRTLPPYKIPATIRFVTSLEIGASGKLARVHA